MEELKFRDAVVTDLSSIIALLADDELGQKRENIKKDMPSEYLYAFEIINQDVNQRLIVITDEKT